MIAPNIKMLSDPSSLSIFIKPQVSRFCLDLATGRFFTSNKEVNFSFQDKSARCLIQPMLDSIPKKAPSNSLINDSSQESPKHFPITKARFKEDFDMKPEDLMQFVEKYYYPMKSIALDIKKNENNYCINQALRKPNKSAYDIHLLEFYNSVKGLVLVDQDLLSGSGQPKDI